MNLSLSNIVSKWLSRIILRTSATTIKLAFRKIENISVKIVKLEENQSFNETCIINKLLPTYTNIYIYMLY